jgi:hypothetical protein
MKTLTKIIVISKLKCNKPKDVWHKLTRLSKIQYLKEKNTKQN